MVLKISLPLYTELKPKLLVFGVGGAGGNAVNNMIDSELVGVDFWVANTDAQALAMSKAANKIQLGINCTRGLGAGSCPEIGKISAEESISEIESSFEDCHMVFITAGMGGGTGTGAAPIIAEIAKKMGILVVGVVTKPFHFEGSRRMKIAESGLEEISRYIDTLIVIPNQNLFRVANEKTTFGEAFQMADTILKSGVRAVTDLIAMPGLINLDFADIKTIMRQMGKAMMGTGEAEGEERAIKAAEAAISNPLLDNSSMKGAQGVLINTTGGADITLFEIDEVVNRIKEEVDQAANIIFGSTFDESLNGKIRVSVVATGIDNGSKLFSDSISISKVKKNNSNNCMTDGDDSVLVDTSSFVNNGILDKKDKKYQNTDISNIDSLNINKICDDSNNCIYSEKESFFMQKLLNSKDLYDSIEQRNKNNFEIFKESFSNCFLERKTLNTTICGNEYLTKNINSNEIFNKNMEYEEEFYDIPTFLRKRRSF